MDRELFKAKHKQGGMWLIGVPMKIENKYMLLLEDTENSLRVHYIDDEMWLAEIYAVEIEEDTLCRYTGLTDKNGNKIWENDIVFVTDDDGNSGQVDTGLGEVVFLEGLWYISGRVQNSLYDINKCFQIEVIGSVFDNQELVGGAE